MMMIMIMKSMRMMCHSGVITQNNHISFFNWFVPMNSFDIMFVILRVPRVFTFVTPGIKIVIFDVTAAFELFTMSMCAFGLSQG